MSFRETPLNTHPFPDFRTCRPRALRSRFMAEVHHSFYFMIPLVLVPFAIRCWHASRYWSCATLFPTKLFIECHCYYNALPVDHHMSPCYWAFGRLPAFLPSPIRCLVDAATMP